ncbi:ATP-dependent zinc metalloprotease FtsH [Anaerocolumna aminovalerica]|jgi:cell division protease FtsH|uniref:Membrane protease FtsH catalytic subunit n=1 Tax=Anaerocolumna aminovalerica TaxID=1527 RepID=A0A1I5F4L7_9FIRM|nr:FtsH/Yme1/Tma family ATP-dependent metallopeptidase [Anaerocolumna aminovalerica]MBU5332570.1 ATP-dependent metallopeptidase FtsH/Yme1/Tma family protein [Anaerocolumna aminovalerica]MDU6264904.1 ATP-dependent metallopeptidase FtsH/Yme1/Tma family protein [Anaerocolumna aminovalerica]SFO18559.1 membrane protease FtsH catalytic subunit [Anaerocolumna aminovalerica]
MKRKYLIILSVLFLIITAGLIGYHFLDTKQQDMSYPSFLEAVEKKEVEKVTFIENKNLFKVNLNTEENVEYLVPNPKTENFTEYLLLKGINISYGTDGFTRFIQVTFTFLVIGSVIWLAKRGSTSSNLAEDSNKKKQKSSTVTLDQVAGNAEAKLMVEDVIGFIKNPEKYTSVGAKMPKGLLFYGPPGTGKTLMAKAIAGEANVPFYAMSGSDFVQMYVGVGASRIRNLFKKAKKSEKAVIFIDEIDAIGKKRARSLSASNDERDQTLNALLTEMSGFHENSGIIVIGATNRLDTLDEALLRPGRFDRQIEIGLPDINARKKILSLYAKSKPLADDVDLEDLAKSTVYFSGAMLENLLNEAAIHAANDGKSVIGKSNIDTAFYTVIAGSPKIDRSFISDQDRKITAYHEAGHALTTTLLLPEHYLSKVTIIPSVKGAGGFNLSIPKDTLFQTKKQIEANIKVLLAGRVAEELIFGEDEITTGASNDIQKASSLILNYMNKYGMDSDMGLFSMEVLEEGHDLDLVNKCRTQMNTFYKDTKKLMEENLELLKNIAEELLEKESLNQEDINRICH